MYLERIQRRSGKHTYFEYSAGHSTGVKSSLLESTNAYNNITTTKRSLEYCERAISDLDQLVGDMMQHIDSIRMIKRSKFRLKAVLKKGQIQLYQDRLQSALQLLTLSHQAYIGYVSFLTLFNFSSTKNNRSLTQVQSALVVARLEALQQGLSSDKEPKKPHHTNTSRNGGNWSSLTKLPWYAPGYFGRVNCEVKSRTSQGASYNGMSFV